MAFSGCKPALKSFVQLAPLSSSGRRVPYTKNAAGALLGWAWLFDAKLAVPLDDADCRLLVVSLPLTEDARGTSFLSVTAAAAFNDPLLAELLELPVELREADLPGGDGGGVAEVIGGNLGEELDLTFALEVGTADFDTGTRTRSLLVRWASPAAQSRAP